MSQLKEHFLTLRVFMNDWMGIFRTISSLDAMWGRDEGELLGMLRGRRAAGGRRSWDWVKPLGMQKLFTWGRADCGLSGYVMPACTGLCLLYNTKGKERKGTLYGVFSSWYSFLNLLSASVVGSLETHLMCVHIRHEALSSGLIYNISKPDTIELCAWSGNIKTDVS